MRITYKQLIFLVTKIHWLDRQERRCIFTTMTKLYVANLPYTLSDVQLKEIFLPFGSITDVFIVKDKASGKSKGFGFVEMEHEESAQKAIQDLHNTFFGKRKLVVAMAKPKSEKSHPITAISSKK
jgi:RNA recognition motif-containing protein